MYIEQKKPCGCSHHYLTIVQRVKKSLWVKKKTLQPFQADGCETPSNSWDDSNPTFLGCPLDEENEYWLKRYGHKRWFPKYVDQSGAPGRAEGWVWLEGWRGWMMDTTCPKNPTGK